MARKQRFRCPHCGHFFQVSEFSIALRPHLGGRGVYLRCPDCHTANWMLPAPPLFP